VFDYLFFFLNLRIRTSAGQESFEPRGFDALEKQANSLVTVAAARSRPLGNRLLSGTDGNPQLPRVLLGLQPDRVAPTPDVQPPSVELKLATDSRVDDCVCDDSVQGLQSDKEQL
jgi:hypothetical protein